MGERVQCATVLISGGVDSAACAHHLINRGHSVTGVFIDYGQAAAKQERAAATAVAGYLDVEIKHISVSGSDGFGTGELVGRNAFFVFAALFLARTVSGLLAMGLHSGTPYYDCSPEFVDRIRRLVAEHTDGRVVVFAPFIEWTKQDVYDYFIASGIPVEITYSCEAGTEPTCGMCASCRDRGALKC